MNPPPAGRHDAALPPLSYRSGPLGAHVDLIGERFGFTEGRRFEVRFDSVVATDAQRLSDRLIRVKIPSGARPVGLAIDSYGRVFIADQESHAIRVLTGGSVQTVAGGREGFTDGSGANATFNSPQFLAFDNSGDLLVGDLLNHAIRKLRLD